MKNSFLLRLLLAAGLASTIMSANAELMVGDPAPKFQVGKWIQGEPVKAFDSNHVYIVEFWATWCGPCVASIPHLNELSQKFKDKGVISIGVDVWDSDDSVAPFVKKMGDKMTYRVALDDKSRDPSGFMGSTWWKRKVNNHGIPTAFIINRDGIIAWIGHPMGLKEEIVDEIVSGHYDMAKAVVDYKKGVEENNKLQDLQEKLFSAVNNKKWDEAESTLNETVAAFPKLENSFAGTRLRILLGRKDYDQAYQFVEQFSNSHPRDFGRQNVLAWYLLTQEGVPPHGLDLAEKVAARANESSGRTNTEILDTLARAQFMNGRTNEAVATETSALQIASDDGEKQNYKKSLADYQSGKLPDVK